MAPIDKDLIDQNIMNKKEKKWINNYHQEVFNNLKKFMKKTEIEELNKSCSAI
jgi:Xaa-Pro aminopeptidase